MSGDFFLDPGGTKAQEQVISRMVQGNFQSASSLPVNVTAVVHVKDMYMCVCDFSFSLYLLVWNMSLVCAAPSINVILSN